MNQSRTRYLKVLRTYSDYQFFLYYTPFFDYLRLLTERLSMIIPGILEGTFVYKEVVDQSKLYKYT